MTTFEFFRDIMALVGTVSVLLVVAVVVLAYISERRHAKQGGKHDKRR
jgi:hypothetical protein